MHARNLVSNGQAQPVAFAAGARHAVEAIQHTSAFLQRHAGAIIFNLQKRHARVQVSGTAQGDRAAARGVFQGVVHQITQEFTQQPLMAGNVHGLHLQPQIDAPGRRRIQMGFQQSFTQFLQIHPKQGLCVEAVRVGP